MAPHPDNQSNGSRINQGGNEPAVAKKILVVEDNKDFAEPLVCLLEMRGHTVVLVHDGAGGLQALQDNPFDVVLLDIGLPRMDGYEVARRMRLLPGRSPVIIALTGYGQQADRVRSKAAGFDNHLLKPFVLPDLEKAIAASARGVTAPPSPQGA